MANKPDGRLIILLPSDLLEDVRRAAEEADLSVSQIVRRALRNELKAIAQKDVPGTDVTLALETLGKLLLQTKNNAFYGDPVPASLGSTLAGDSMQKVAEILRNKPRERK
jgi:Ribbon-helix-helix protein, copG family